MTQGDWFLHNHTRNTSNPFQSQFLISTFYTDLKGLFTSSFDAKIAPEHLLRLCLEHDDKFIPRKSNCAYNFYKACSFHHFVIVLFYIILSFSSLTLPFILILIGFKFTNDVQIGGTDYSS